MLNDWNYILKFGIPTDLCKYILLYVFCNKWYSKPLEWSKQVSMYYLVNKNVIMSDMYYGCIWLFCRKTYYKKLISYNSIYQGGPVRRDSRATKYINKYGGKCKK